MYARAAEGSVGPHCLPQKCTNRPFAEPRRGVFCKIAQPDVRWFLHQQDWDRRFEVYRQYRAGGIPRLPTPAGVSGAGVRFRKDFSLRSPEWWRHLTLGLLLGGSLIWALSDTTFHSETVCVAIPLALALLSPRRVLTVFWGWSLYRKHGYWSLPLRFTFIKTFQAARRFDRYHAGSL